MANGLGRGLSSLIPQKVNKPSAAAGGEAIVNTTSAADKSRIVMVAPDRISPNPRQPRRKFPAGEMNELTESIRAHGIIQPLIVTARGDGYELIAGERRLRAAAALKMEKVPCLVRDADEQQKLELSLVENLQRSDLNPLETAMAYRKLLDEFNLTQEELARRVGRSRPAITNTLRLLGLPAAVQDALAENRISEGHAKLLAGLESEAKQLAAMHKIVDGKMTVDDSMKEVRRMGGTKHARIKINYGDKDKEFALREFFGTKVRIERKGRGGRILIDFYSDEELGEIVRKVKK